MDVVSILPSPPHFFRLFVRLGLSLFNSTISGNYRRMLAEPRPQVDFDIDPINGFFPPNQLPHLPEEYSIWEQALLEAPDVLSLGKDDREEAVKKRPLGYVWRSSINTWPVLETAQIRRDLRLLQRAHLVLAWLVNYYVHSQPLSEDDIIIPKSLAIPLVTVSRCLGIAPVLTFADTVLWNCAPRDPSQPISMTNLKFENSFTGTEDEAGFYLTSARAELRGVEMLQIIDDYNRLPTFTDLTTISKVSRDLNRLSSVIDDIKDIIKSVRPLCDPHVFYFEIRPWWAGSGAAGPDSPKWIYEGVQDSHRLDLSGPSAGQSSVMHALDLFLDIDHKLREKRLPAPTDMNKRADHGFMERMRRYMPGSHREYLNALATSPKPIRDLAQKIPMVRDPYDNAVLALKRLRDEHMKVACLYVVNMSRSTSAKDRYPTGATTTESEARPASGSGHVRGTGGNELSVLLKAGRDATQRALLKKN